MGRLDGKVAIITGAGAGMGRAAAILFAKEGAKVVVNDIVREGGEETVRMVREAGGDAVFIEGDVSKKEDWRKMIRAALDNYGKLNVLYNNAAIALYQPLLQSTDENFDKTMEVNVKGIWLGMKYSIPEMIRVGGGSIINVSSIAADAAERGSAIYAASKGAVISMSRVAAVEHAAHNIRVNVIKPGAIATPMFMSVFKDNPDAIKRYLREIPQGRLGDPEEVAYLALFLASDESSRITGQKLTADGGIEADSHVV